jgi:hypothetical protein
MAESTLEANSTVLTTLLFALTQREEEVHGK